MARQRREPINTCTITWPESTIGLRLGRPNFGQLTEAFKKAQQIQQDAAKLQEELDAMEIEGQSSCGRASVWLSGNQQPLKVRLDPALLAEGATSTENATLEALTSAYDNSTGTMKERMEELTGGLNLNLPGMG